MKTHFYLAAAVLAALLTAGCSNGNVCTGEDNRQETGDGKLYDKSGRELCLWGVNFQPCLSWEYHSRLAARGIPETAEALEKVVDSNLPDLLRLGANAIRCHLTPADFTDAEGNLVETPYLKVLDYMVAQASARGIYMIFAFINHMGFACVPESVFNNVTREDWIQDPATVEKSKRYIRALLGRTNPYTGRKYAEEPYIAVWEIINEPDMYDWDEVKSHENAFRAYEEWAEENSYEVSEGNWPAYREESLKTYIDSICALVRECSATQPVIWSHNWHRYRNSTTMDIFNAALASSADGVSFCCYPGQDLVTQDYWNHPKDLTGEDYSDWFDKWYGEVCGYGWTRLPEYDDRIKTVYEFETFFNQSAYLYPAMALYFRSLNVSSATMWTYTMQEYAPWHCGSHFLSMTCTPRKAASFMVAGEIFRHIPAGQEYSRSTNEQTGTNYAISRSRDLSIWSDSEQLIYSGDITQWTPVGISPAVKKIAGVGSSPLVKYDGTGLYFVEDKGDELRITVNPDHTWTGEPWNSLQTGEVSRLDYDAVHEMSISLDAWPEGSYILYRIDDSGRTAVSELSELRGITVSPGEYAITRK